MSIWFDTIVKIRGINPFVGLVRRRQTPSSKPPPVLVRSMASPRLPGGPTH